METRLGRRSCTTPPTSDATRNSQLLLAVVIRACASTPNSDDPTALPTPVPTSCKHERKWYVSFNPYACTNGDNTLSTLFNLPKDCYEEMFNASSGDHSCRRINA